uniref:NADH-ubiquinone oxidoreductase chain 6 n=1 Tax=Apriona germarii TaxID=157307 RepID=A0A8F0WNJ4_APRGE|nr:NADH dehydrogenase subunit 6 [Apriona germarii]QWM97269.1 NADH dehydrogenase subunit 6 [Apriona germarii]
MMLSIIMMMTIFALIFIFLTHPLSFGLILLLETILISMLSGLMNFNYWYSYILFLIMIGGMLILFIYMTSVASNEKFKFSNKIFMLSIFILLFFSLFILLDEYFLNTFLLTDLFNQNQNFNFKMSLNKFFIWPMNMIFFLMINYLLVTLIMVVKITNIQYGPLRQKT